MIFNIISVFKRLQTNLNSLIPNKFPNMMNLCNRDLRNKVKLSYLNKLTKIKYKIMSLRNRVTLIGYTGKEVEIVNFEKGKIAKVSLATNDYYTNAKGEKVEETQWHNLVANGKLADIMEKYVQKGKEISVEGKIVYKSYDDKDGNKRFITEIRVDELVLLGNRQG